MVGRQKLVYGWGINNADYAIWQCSIYQCWKNMIKRCYCFKAQEDRPTYIGCLIDERWKYFMVFRAWYLEQSPSPGEQLDKDFLGNGKLYSPETCCFISKWLNLLFTDHGVKRGLWPQGVHYHNQTGKYQAKINRKGKKFHLGYFSTPAEASEVYLEAKAAYVEELLTEFPQTPRLAAAIRRKMTKLIENEVPNG